LEAGDVINQFIGQIYDGTRIIRIIGEDEAAKMVTINDPNDPESPNLATGKYDVTITTGASYTTRRVEAAEAMMEAVQVFPQMMEIAGDLVAKAQDWPGAEELADRLRKTVPPQLLSDKEKQEMGDQGPNVQQLMQQGAQMQEAMQPVCRTSEASARESHSQDEARYRNA
jgi:non-homologous end joining protein Ku